MLLAVAAVCMVPATDAEPFTNVGYETDIIEVGEDGVFTIIFSDPSLEGTEEEVSISYKAKLTDSKGETMSSAVSPSSGDLTNDVSEEITVEAPKEAGKYTLVVEYTYKVGDADEKVITEEKTVRAVEPITLSVTLSNKDGNVDAAIGLYFVVDGNVIEDSYTTTTFNKDGTATASYDWIAAPSDGKHTFKVIPAEGEALAIEGLGETHTFYVGETSYTTYIILAVLFVAIMVFVLIWVYRKPVKNYGKPKSRR